MFNHHKLALEHSDYSRQARPISTRSFPEDFGCVGDIPGLDPRNPKVSEYKQYVLEFWSGMYPNMSDSLRKREASIRFRYFILSHVHKSQDRVIENGIKLTVFV